MISNLFIFSLVMILSSAPAWSVTSAYQLLKTYQLVQDLSRLNDGEIHNCYPQLKVEIKKNQLGKSDLIISGLSNLDPLSVKTYLTLDEAKLNKGPWSIVSNYVNNFGNTTTTRFRSEGYGQLSSESLNAYEVITFNPGTRQEQVSQANSVNLITTAEGDYVFYFGQRYGSRFYPVTHCQYR